ncbi:uncharacterized protein LOC118187186 [Stegodyphus dumicola]|uniref:uncharacterized protein LOC118187186 n=1 Tax=Stegodyphus dumicola TaxID=202533 RepID=UPI0015B0F49F|nr:uncharacterized protein LOC118187186 [Stegodyphus dumicola]
MFVHNNSKHSRKRAMFHKSDSIINKRSRLQEEFLPKVHVIYPEKGFFSQRIFVSGENFNPCVQICLNNTPLRTKFLGPTALSANIPPFSHDCDFYVSVREKNKIYCDKVLFKYVYKSNIVPIVTDVCQKSPGQVSIYGHNLDSDGLEVFMGMTPLRMQMSRGLIKAEIQEYSGNPVHAYMPVTVRWENMMIIHSNESSMTFTDREFICSSHSLGNQKTEDFTVSLQPQRQAISDQSVSEESNVSSVDVSGVSPVSLNGPDQVLDANSSCMVLPRMSNAQSSYPAPYANSSLICNTSGSPYKNQMFLSNGSSDYTFIHTPMPILQRNRNLIA